MARRIHAPILLILMLAGDAFGQTPPPLTTAGNARIYILLKPDAAQAGDARDAFVQRMTALGVTNLQFLTGANAARCEAPVSAQASIGADPDVTGVLPLDAPAAPPAPPVAPAPATPPSAPPVASAPTTPPSTPPVASAPTAPPPTPAPAPGPVFGTPPYIPPPPSMPISASVPMGGGMSAGMAMLTDFAGNLVVKLLAPGSSCKIRLHGSAAAIASAGGAGAFEVKSSGNCAWQAVSTADWLQVKTEVNTAGTVAVVYTAARNSGAHRQAVVVIQPVIGLAPLKGHTVTVVAQQ